jgi:hypothetical protein
MVALCFFSTSRQTSSVIWVVAMAGLIGCRDEVAKRPLRGDKRERKALRQEARGIIAEGRPEAREFRDRHGNLRIGLIPEATRTYQPREMQALKLGGFNIRRYPWANYEEALQTPKSAR